MQDAIDQYSEDQVQSCAAHFPFATFHPFLLALSFWRFGGRASALFCSHSITTLLTALPYGGLCLPSHAYRGHCCMQTRGAPQSDHCMHRKMPLLHADKWCSPLHA